MCAGLPFDLDGEETAYINKFVSVLRYGDDSVKQQILGLIESAHSAIEKEDNRYENSDEHGHDHGDGHSHDHDHGDGHSHSHSHGHGDEHELDHEHGHAHVH